jgi:cytochrome b561
MPVSNTALRYGTVAMALHWLIAALIIANICIGLYFSDLLDTARELPKDQLTEIARYQTMAYAWIPLHKSIGLTVLTLSVLRLVWRLVNPVPPPPAGLEPWLKFAARAMHVVLYVLIVGIPLSGWLMVSVGSMGHATPVFGLFGWPGAPILSGLPRSVGHPYHEFFETIHVWLAWSAIVLVPIHILAALYHQFVRGDDVLRRMLPGTNIAGNA